MGPDFTALKNIPGKLRDILREKPRLVWAGIGLAGLLCVCIILAFLLIRTHNKAEADRAAREFAESFSPLAIPADELFLPEEPDFLPEILLNREPKQGWTARDAEAYWTDPLEEGRDIWLERIRSNMDELMESVP